MRRLLLVLLTAAAFGVVARGGVPCDVLGLQPRCYVALLPGPTSDTLDAVEVGGQRTYTSAGSLLLTTVAVEAELDLAEWLRTAVSPRVQQVPREQLYPPGETDDEVRRANIASMDASQLAASAAALRQLGFEVDLRPQGADVVEVLPGTPASSALEVGDVIVAVDGKPTLSAQAVIDAIDARAPGEPVALTLARGRGRERIELTTTADPAEPAKPSIGAVVRDHVLLPIDVRIDAGAVGGPSAGLMFALAIVDELTPEDLTAGAVIAGTGTITDDGTVGGIGGIRQKVLGALERAPEGAAASVFLVPRDNLDEARGAPVEQGITLVPVGTLAEAVEALRQLAAGQQPAGAVALGPTG